MPKCRGQSLALPLQDDVRSKAYYLLQRRAECNEITRICLAARCPRALQFNIGLYLYELVLRQCRSRSINRPTQ